MSAHKKLRSVFSAKVQVASEKEQISFLKAVERNDLQKVAAVLKVHPKAVTWSHWEGGGLLPLHLAVEKGHVGMVTLLLDHGAKVNGRDFGDTPLTRAVHQDDIDINIVEVLLARGGNPAAVDTLGWTVLDTAREFDPAAAEVIMRHMSEKCQKKNEAKQSMQRAALENELKVFTEGLHEPLPIRRPIQFQVKSKSDL